MPVCSRLRSTLPRLLIHDDSQGHCLHCIVVTACTHYMCAAWARLERGARDSHSLTKSRAMALAIRVAHAAAYLRAVVCCLLGLRFLGFYLLVARLQS